MRTRNLRIALGSLSILLGVMAYAGEVPFSEAARVPDGVLDEVRGGFEAPATLHASLTLDRVAYVNGERVASSSVSIPDIANMTAEQATALAETAGMLLIQNGPNNAFNVADLGPASTVIQNTLSDQHLMTLTTISVEVNSLGAFRDMNFQDGLRDSITTIPGVR
jgi:hypothetical protein